MHDKKVIAIIPARFASTRFPGKPLVDLGGKPMIQRTYDRVMAVQGWQRVVIATDDLQIKDVAEGFGATVDFEIRKGYPFLHNNPALTARSKAAALNYMGEENIVDLDIWMAAEDFAYYSQEADACFYRLGTRNESKGIVSGVHTPTFDIDEEALEIGAGLMAYLAITELEVLEQL